MAVFVAVFGISRLFSFAPVAAIPEWGACVALAHGVIPLRFANPLSDVHPGSSSCSWLCKLRAHFTRNCISGLPFVRVRDILTLLPSTGLNGIPGSPIPRTDE